MISYTLGEKFKKDQGRSKNSATTEIGGDEKDNWYDSYDEQTTTSNTRDNLG